MLPRSLFGRMLVLSLLTTLAALVIAGAAIGGVLQRFVTSSVDARLGDRLIALESAVRPDGTLDHDQLARVTARIAPDEPWRIDLAGARLGSDSELRLDASPRHPPRPTEGPAPFGPDLRTQNDTGAEPFEGRGGDGGRVHGLSATVTTKGGDALVAVAVPRAAIDRPVVAALAPLAGSLAILGVALGGAALLQLRLGLRPLRALRSAVEAIRHGRSTSVAEPMPAELAPLAAELNALAVDTAAALAVARASAANLAHALKTPVATLSLHLADDPAAQAQLARIDATVRHHLGRARAAVADRRATTALVPALSDLAATIAALHGGRVAISVEASADLAAAIGAQDLDELAGNLIDNAARHAGAGVRVSVHAEERRVVLTVADDGPGIPAAARMLATAPGARLDERGDGHGFGLAIARELTALHGGELTLDDAPGGGLLVRVALPRAG